MASKLSYENATKALQFIRNFLAGKTLQIASRHSQSQSSRNIPKPNLPNGEAHKLSSNYYVTRDTRRAAMPPLKIKVSQELVTDGQMSGTKSNLTPADVYHPRP